MSRFLKSPRVVLLTGGTSGVGAAMRQRLLEANHEVIVIARRASTLPPQNCLHTLDCDLSDAKAVMQAVTELKTRWPIDVLINNAALQYDRALIDPALDVERLSQEVAVNLLAPALLIHGLAPAMIATGHSGVIVNVNSGLALCPKAKTALYCATKAALRSLSQSLAYQLEGSAVRVVDVYLPLVDTPMTQGRGSRKITAQKASDAILNGIDRGHRRIWIGQAGALPWLSRIAPGVARAALKGPPWTGIKPGLAPERPPV